MTPHPSSPLPTYTRWSSHSGSRVRWLIAVLAVAALVGTGVGTHFGARAGDARVASSAPIPTKSSANASSVLPAPTGAVDRAGRHPVRIRQPVTTPRVETGLLDSHGQPVTASCASCHATSRPRPETHSAADLDEFHQGLKYAHGDQSCLVCHHAQDYDRLRLADGRSVEFADAMVLCAQCHGPQYRDYRNGSHGGMTGYWDLRRGPRERNHCIDCHDPHAPAYPVVRPAFAPAPDRGLPPNSVAASHE